MVNNLKPLILRMRSSVSGPLKKRRTTDFGDSRSFFEYEQTLTQENEPSVKERTAYRVRLPLIQEFAITSIDPKYEGKEFENELFLQFKDGIELATSENGWPGVKKRDMRLCRVTGFERATIDFIAYNKKYWFPVEIKDQRTYQERQRPLNERRYPHLSGIVGFRNQKQFQRLFEPDETVIPAALHLRWITEKLEELPGIVLKRRFVSNIKGHKSASFCEVYSVHDSF